LSFRGAAFGADNVGESAAAKYTRSLTKGSQGPKQAQKEKEKEGQQLAASSAATVSSAASTLMGNEEVQYDITHNSIVISWQNGQANGLTIEEFVVEMARVRTYRLKDVVRAKEAYQNIEDDKEEEQDDDSFVTPPSAAAAAAAAAVDSEGNPGEGCRVVSGDASAGELTRHVDCWGWHDITRTGGYFLGFQRFKATNLLPGNTYIFRVKQKNSCGWSSFSGASRMIATYPSVPPGQPSVFVVRSTYAGVQWAESACPGIGLSNLEYEVQLGVVPPALAAAVVSVGGVTANGGGGVGDGVGAAVHPAQHETVWNTVEVQYFSKIDALLKALQEESAALGPGGTGLPYAPTAAAATSGGGGGGVSGTGGAVASPTVTGGSADHLPGGENSTELLLANFENGGKLLSDYVDDFSVATSHFQASVHVLLPRLVSGVTYILRVRVRTVVGWSPWSVISNPFKTLI
jgi:hypothetical protein